MGIINTRWQKALRDLWVNRGRTFLVMVAMVLGVLSVGMMSTTYSILRRELRTNYLATNPASATLWIDPLDDEFVAAVRNLPTISEAEARRMVVGRILVGPDEWRNIWLFVIKDFDDIRISRFAFERGAWPPTTGEILLERAALPLAQANIGQTVVVKTPGGPRRELRISGIVHDMGLPPAWQENLVYGYITLDTLAGLGVAPQLNELKITVAANLFDENHVRDVAEQLKAWSEEKGRQVYRIQILPPGEHPHQFQMDSLLLLQQAFGLLALLLSGVLVANMIAALLTQQVRQIGVMKAVGANPGQVMGLYYGLVLILSLAALGLATPVGLWLGRTFAHYMASILNFDLASEAVPPWAYALQVTVSLLIPLLAATYPIYKGSRITVQQAINDYGVGQGQFGATVVDRLLGRLGGLARPLLLSIRNTFRRRGRLALTLFVLAVGGATFMAVLNLRSSLRQTIAVVDSAYNFDILLSFSRSYPVAEIAPPIRDIPGVAQVEIFGGAKAARRYPNGIAGNPFDLLALPSTSELFDFPLIAGRWLRPDDENALVINHSLLADEPDLAVGDDIVLTIEGQETTWQVVGIVKQVMSLPTVYVNYDHLAQITNQVGYARNVAVVTVGHDAMSQRTVMQRLEGALETAGLDVFTNLSFSTYRQAIEDHLYIIVAYLVLMTFFSVIVGGLGLMTTMSINVIERTRELGVMRAVGASNHALLQTILGEGALIGLSSWVLAAVLAWPTSLIFGNVFGTLLLETPLDFAFDPLGLFWWLVIAITFSAIASFLPAWNAAQLTVSEVLAYE